MRAEVIGCTFVITPETDDERKDLEYRGGVGLWESYGFVNGTLDVQPMCPVGLQDNEILKHLRFMLEMEDQPYPEDSEQLSKRLMVDSETMDRVRTVLGCDAN